MAESRGMTAWVSRLVACLCVMIGPFAAIAGPSDPTAASAMPYRIEWGVKIPMRDGVTLDATIFRPAADKPVPVILTLTPFAFSRFSFVARTIASGSVLRMVIVPLGASYHGDRNRNSGKPVADETAADDRIAHGSLALGRGLSHVDLP